jgi:uncharacterized membrane protein
MKLEEIVLIGSVIGLMFSLQLLTHLFRQPTRFSDLIFLLLGSMGGHLLYSHNGSTGLFYLLFQFVFLTLMCSHNLNVVCKANAKQTVSGLFHD